MRIMVSPMSLAPIMVSLLAALSIDGTPDTVPSKADLDKSYKFVLPWGPSERDLEECQDIFSPCSIIQNTFFYPFIVKRLCRCKDKQCPDTYDVERKLDTVFINNREQMKFCNDLPRCKKNWGVLRVGLADDLPYHLNCFCPPKRRYWKRLPNMLPDSPHLVDQNKGHGNNGHDDFRDDHEPESDKRLPLRDILPNEQDGALITPSVPTTFFKCEKMELCRGSACGTLRLDLYSTYQNCTCPWGTLCLPTRNPTTTLNEALYNNGGKGRFSKCH